MTFRHIWCNFNKWLKFYRWFVCVKCSLKIDSKIVWINNHNIEPSMVLIFIQINRNCYTIDSDSSIITRIEASWTSLYDTRLLRFQICISITTFCSLSNFSFGFVSFISLVSFLIIWRPVYLILYEFWHFIEIVDYWLRNFFFNWLLF